MPPCTVQILHFNSKQRTSSKGVPSVQSACSFFSARVLASLFVSTCAACFVTDVLSGRYQTRSGHDRNALPPYDQQKEGTIEEAKRGTPSTAKTTPSTPSAVGMAADSLVATELSVCLNGLLWPHCSSGWLDAAVTCAARTKLLQPVRREASEASRKSKRCISCFRDSCEHLSESILMN